MSICSKTNASTVLVLISHKVIIVFVYLAIQTRVTKHKSKFTYDILNYLKQSLQTLQYVNTCKE